MQGTGLFICRKTFVAEHLLLVVFHAGVNSIAVLSLNL